MSILATLRQFKQACDAVGLQEDGVASCISAFNVIPVKKTINMRLATTAE